MTPFRCLSNFGSPPAGIVDTVFVGLFASSDNAVDSEAYFLASGSKDPLAAFIGPGDVYQDFYIYPF